MMEIEIYKRRSTGWQAKTAVPMPDGRVLEICTSKTFTGLVSRAQVYKIDGYMKSYVLFGDYSVALLESDKRATEKSVMDLHRAALARIDDTLAAAKAFYEAKEAEQ
jgi:hypothetical protein